MKSEQVIETFASIMIERMEQMKDSAWKQGWVGTSFGGMPINLRGTEYNGTNSFLLFMVTQMEGWKYPIFATVHQINELGGRINKGEKSFPVIFWKMVYKTEDGKRLDYHDYMELSKQERDKCTEYPTMKSYNVFNLCQTNLEEVNPKCIDKLKAKFNVKEPVADTFGMYENHAIDIMLERQEWVCPIQYNKPSNRAFYRPSTDEIVVPQKTQFFTGETDEERFISGMSFYDTLLHEMAHSTGHPKRLDRGEKKAFGSKEYAKEELVAELSAAMCGQRLGFDHRILDNNAAYLDGWISVLKREPKFIISVLADVSKAVNMICDVICKDECVKTEKAA